MASVRLAPPFTSLIDIGANLTHRTFRNSLTDVLQRASDANVRQIIITGTNLVASREALRLAERFNREQSQVKLYSTVGIHPHDATRHSKFNYRDQLIELIEKHPVVAVGECGLDFDRNFSTPEDQRQVFQTQLELADQYDLPLFMHERAASTEMLKILKKFSTRERFRGVIHCFTHGSAEILKEYLSLNLYIGITGWICDDRRGDSLATIVSEIPLNRLLIETDAPFLLPRNLPRPWPDQNEPCYLPWIVKKLASCYGVPVEEIIERSSANAIDLFQLIR